MEIIQHLLGPTAHSGDDKTGHQRGDKVSGCAEVGAGDSWVHSHLGLP